MKKVKKSLTIAKWWLKWSKSRSFAVRQSTMDTYTFLWHSQLEPVFGDKYVVKEEDVQSFVDDKYKKGTSINTLKACIVVLGMVVRFADVKTNWRIKYPKEYSHKNMQVFSDTDIAQLYKYLSENISPRNIGILLCMHTGIRIGELCGIKWEDINLEHGILKVNRTIYRGVSAEREKHKTSIVISSPKTPNSVRQIPLPQQLVDKLRDIRNIYKCDDKMFLLTSNARCMEPRVLRRYYYDILNQLHVTKHRFHDLRHTFASFCIENGTDPKTVSMLLGHANVKTTLNLYVHPTVRQQVQCINAITEKLTKQMGDYCS